MNAEKLSHNVTTGKKYTNFFANYKNSLAFKASRKDKILKQNIVVDSNIKNIDYRVNPATNENSDRTKHVVTTQHVGSLFNNNSTSRNKFQSCKSSKDLKEANKEYRKGILLRRSLAQTPPIFKQNQTDDCTVVIDVDQSVSNPITLTTLKSSNQQIKEPKKDNGAIIKVTPKNPPARFNEGAVEFGPFFSFK